MMKTLIAAVAAMLMSSTAIAGDIRTERVTFEREGTTIVRHTLSARRRWTGCPPPGRARHRGLDDG
jgi:hypothetical protein